MSHHDTLSLICYNREGVHAMPGPTSSPLVAAEQAARGTEDTESFILVAAPRRYVTIAGSVWFLA